MESVQQNDFLYISSLSVTLWYRSARINAVESSNDGANFDLAAISLAIIVPSLDTVRTDF